MTKVDLKDAYFTIPIHTSNRPVLRFSVRDCHYQFTCLPFGLSSAPWVFTKTLKPVTTLLRELGVRLVIYIDDILVMAETPEMARDHTLGLIYLLENLGFIVHPEKTQSTPTQEIEFLGMQVDSRTMELRVPGTKLKKIRAEVAKIRDQQATPSARGISRLLGKLNAISQAIPPGPLFCRSIQRDLAKALDQGNQSYDVPCPLSPVAMEELTWWNSQLTRWNGKSLVLRKPDLQIESDASRIGWGACLNMRVHTGGPWSTAETAYHINCLELLAACCHIGGQDISEGPGKQTRITANRQSNSSGVHKQSGRDSLRPSHDSSQRALDVVPREGNTADCRQHSTFPES